MSGLRLIPRKRKDSILRSRRKAELAEKDQTQQLIQYIMANEIQINATMAATKNNSSIGGGGLFNYTMAGNFTNKVNQSISNSGWTALSYSSTITTPTAIYVKNLDTVNGLTLAVDNAGTNKFAFVPPGGTITLIVPASVSYWASPNRALHPWVHRCGACNKMGVFLQTETP